MKIQKRKSLAVLSLLTALALQSPNVQGEVPSSDMKWHTGHYIMCLSRIVDTILADFKDTKNLRGVNVTYAWSDLEPSKGVYNFSAIEQDLKIAKKYKKKVSMMLGYKFGTLPKYILDLPKAQVGNLLVPSYYVQNVKTGADNKGVNANFGHPGTLAGVTNLLKELGKRFDLDNDFAFIQFVETSSGAVLTSAQTDNFLKGIMDMEVAARAALPHTPIIQSINFPRNEIPTFMQHFTKNQLGFGGPDTFVGTFDDPSEGLAFPSTQYPGIYRYHEPNYDSVSKRNKLPVSMQAHTGSPRYRTRGDELDKKPNGLTISEGVAAVHKFAMDRLHSNFLTWHIPSLSDPVRAALKAKLANGGGELLNTCPKIYTSCAGAVLPPPPPQGGDDLIAPDVAITAPASGAEAKGASVNVAVSASDNVGVARVDLYADGVLKSSDSSAPYNFVYNIPQNADMGIMLEARAVDAAGNVGVSEEVELLVRNAPDAPADDTVQPTAKILSPLNNAVILKSKGSVTITGKATDNVGVKRMRLLINGVLKKTVYAANISYVWNVSQYNPKIHTLRLESFDQSENRKVHIVRVQLK